MSTLHRVTSTFAVMVLLLSLTTVPALAAAVASASLLSGDVLSGQAETVTFRVNNDGTTGGLLGSADSAINGIQVELPGAVFTDSVTPTNPAGWELEYDAEIGFLYGWVTEEGAEIGPGASLDFSFDVVAERVDDDTAGSLNVFVTDDNGMTLSHAGTLPLTSRILEITGATLVKPAGATNADLTQVTAQQDTAAFDVTVVNHAGVAKDLTVDVEKTGGNSTVTTTPAAPNVAGNSTATTVTLDAVFGNAGSLSLDAVASSGSSEALPLTLPQLTVQAAFAATYVADSIAPATAVQGDDVAFSVQVNKAGAQPAALDAAFSFDAAVDSDGDGNQDGTGTYRSPATGTATFSFGPGNLTAVEMLFPAVTVPLTFLNGEVAPTIPATGVDANGATIDVVITPDLVILDRFAPVVDLFANVGEPAVTGADKAAGDDRPITFTGTAYLDADKTTVCDTCNLQGTATLVTYAGADGTGGQTGEPQSFPLVIEDGQISGSAAFTFPTGTNSAKATVTVVKQTGLTAVGASNAFTVDIIDPVVVQALTQRDGDRDYIQVTMSELVDASDTTGQDWEVDDNFVTAVTHSSDGSSTTTFELELSQKFDSRNATPGVTYEQFTLNDPIFDRVELDLLTQLIEATDGIAPELPVIESVQGMGLQDDAFWTNETTPTITLSNLVPGDVLRLYYDADRDGALEDDELLTSPSGVPVVSATQEVEPSRELMAKDGNGDVVDLPAEFAGDLVAVLTDGGGNTSPRATQELNYDIVIPELAGFSVANGNEVTVTFTEAVPRGRDAAFDWTVFADQDGNGAYRTVESVQYISDTERLLTVSSASYDPAAGAITRARFKYRGPSSQKYEDRATNAFANDETSTNLG